MKHENNTNRSTKTNSAEEGGPKQAMAYIRTSRTEVGDEGWPIPAQRRLIADYANQRAFAVVSVFEEHANGVSRRPQFDQMVALLRADPTTLVVAQKPDRLYRNSKDWITLMEIGCEVHFTQEIVE